MSQGWLPGAVLIAALMS